MPNVYDKITEAKRLIAELEEKEGYSEFMTGRKGLVKPFGSYQTKAHQMELKDIDREFLRIVRGQIAPGSVKALVEDATGRTLISPAIDAELHRAIAEISVVRGLATVQATDKDRINVRTIDEISASYGKLETGSDIPESTPTPDETTKYVEDINALAKLGIDEMSDSDYDLSAYIADSFGRAVGNLENQKFLLGAGHDSLEPEGICTNATLLAAALETAAASAITIEDMLQCIYAVPAQYRKGSSWIVNSLTELELRKLRAAVADGIHEGSFLWQPSVALGAPNTFLGYPIYTQDDIEDLSDTEGVIAVFGNIRLGYRIYDRKGLSVEILRELYREAGLIGFILHARNTGIVVRPADKRIVLLKEHA